jgi:hypothetical protein
MNSRHCFIKLTSNVNKVNKEAMKINQLIRSSFKKYDVMYYV